MHDGIGWAVGGRRSSASASGLWPMPRAGVGASAFALPTSDDSEACAVRCATVASREEAKVSPSPVSLGFHVASVHRKELEGRASGDLGTHAPIGSASSNLGLVLLRNGL